MPSSSLHDFLIAVLLQLPMLFACLAGGIVCVFQWKKMRGAAVLAILGIVIAMIEALLYQAFWNLLWPILLKDRSPDETETLTHVADFLQSCLWAVAIALLIAAAVVGRKSAPAS